MTTKPMAPTECSCEGTLVTRELEPDLSRNTFPDHHKDLLLKVVFHYMGHDMRSRLAREVPESYRLYCFYEYGHMPNLVVGWADGD